MVVEEIDEILRIKMIADLEVPADSEETLEVQEEMVIEEVVEAEVEVVALIEIEIETIMIIEAGLEEISRVLEEIDGLKVKIIGEPLVEENGNHYPVVIRKALPLLGGNLLIIRTAPIIILLQRGAHLARSLYIKEVVMNLNLGGKKSKIQALPHGA